MAIWRIPFSNKAYKLVYHKSGTTFREVWLLRPKFYICNAIVYMQIQDSKVHDRKGSLSTQLHMLE